VRARMASVLDIVGEEISSIRTGRATVSLVEDVVIDAYGGTQKLRLVELSSIAVPDAETIVIEPWDKSIVGDIRKGLQAANLGFNPSVDGDIIRINLPPMTTEDREKYVKLLKSKIENGRIMIRQIRGEAMREIKNAFEKGEISEDVRFAQEKKLQGLTDEFVGKIEEIGEMQRKKLLQV